MFLAFSLMLIAKDVEASEYKPKTKTGDLYRLHCASCHGEKGAGGKSSPLDKNGHAWHHPDDQMFLWIKFGRYGPATRMPGFGKTLAAKEICGLIGLMKKWWAVSQIEIQNKKNEAFVGQNFCNR